jgi:hypothetical protein
MILAGGIAAIASAAEPKLQRGDHALMLGDSITALGINPKFVADYLVMCKPAPDLSVTCVARGGETAKGCSSYAGTDMRLGPTVVTTLFGWNDGGYAPPLTPDRIQANREGLTKIIADARKAGVRMIIIGSPTCGDPDFGFGSDPQKSAGYNRVLAELRDVGRDAAKKEGVCFADVHSLMMDVLAKAKAKYGRMNYCFSESRADGGCHVSESGQLVIAYAFLKAMGCDGHIGTITVDLSTAQAQATEGHKVLSTGKGQVEVESSKYPFCFYGEDPIKATSTRGVIQFMPFNEDLNRFLLIARNLGAGRAKVTWGKASRELTAAQLERGINLAAEFLDNPFSQPFAQVEEQIRRNQGGENYIIGELLHVLPIYEQYLPSEKAVTDQVFAVIASKCRAARDASLAAVKPVKHTIRIEPMK